MNDKSPVITVALLNKLQSAKGGFSRVSLEVLGVGWPPKRGWRKDLIRRAKANEAVAQSALPAADTFGHASVIKQRLMLMSQAERKSLMADLDETYCCECWRITNGDACYNCADPE